MQDKFEDGQVGFEGFVYHDEPEDAATDSHWVGIFDNFGSALMEVQQNLGHYWNGGGSLHRGEVEIDEFTNDPRMPEVAATCYVAPDGTPDKDEWPLLISADCGDCGRSESLHLDDDAATDAGLDSRDGLGCAYTDGTRQHVPAVA